MPTYEYKCEECEYQFEKLQSIKDNPLTECPECQGKVKRLIGGGLGVIFKGSGFYVTDNKRSSSVNSNPKKDTKSETETDKTKKTEKSDSGSKDSAKASA